MAAASVSASCGHCDQRGRRRQQRLVLREVGGGRLAAGARCAVPHEDDRSHRRQRVADRGQHRPHAGVDEDHRVAGVIDDVGQVLRGQPEVQGVEHRAAERDRPVQLQMPVTVPGQRGDAIAPADTEVAQHAAQPQRPRGEVRVGVPEQRLTGPARGQRLAREEAAAALEELGEREGIIHHQVVDAARSSVSSQVLRRRAAEAHVVMPRGRPAPIVGAARGQVQRAARDRRGWRRARRRGPRR